jgi:hypothetical protein
LGFTHAGDEHFDGERLSGQTGEGDIYAMTRAEWISVGGRRGGSGVRGGQSRGRRGGR